MTSLQMLLAFAGASFALNAFFLRAAWKELSETRRLRERIVALEVSKVDHARRLEIVESEQRQRWNVPGAPQQEPRRL